jgi:cytochrome c oxidase assembly protein subunit 15
MLDSKIKYSFLISTILAFCVVGLGAYTRLTDSGLGCPDWPACYGYWDLSTLNQNAEVVKSTFNAKDFDISKAKIEMYHRFLAGSLGLLILINSIIVLIDKKSRNLLWKKILTLNLLIVFQALLGMWTVTLFLKPVIVMGHLLGGMLITLLLWTIYKNYNQKETKHTGILYTAIMIALITQIFLGGWTSANYAALVCSDFPYCEGKLLPKMDLPSAFSFFKAEVSEEYGFRLPYRSLVTIHMLHRIGAVIISLLILFVAYKLYKKNKIKHLLFLLAVLICQITLGISNIVYYLPINVAVMHNLCALILLLALYEANKSLSNAKYS